MVRLVLISQNRLEVITRLWFNQPQKPVNEHLMEVLIFTDALKRASAASITVIMPYYGYSRQDRKAKSRHPSTAKLVADLLQVAGVDRVICIDLHAAQLQGFFNIPIDNFPGMPLLSSTLFKSKSGKCHNRITRSWRCDTC